MRQRSSLHKWLRLQAWAVLLPWLVLLTPGRNCNAQTAVSPEILPDIVIFPEQVVAEQWPAMLETVHPPKELKQVEPGQCIRFGVFASGNSRELLQTSKYAIELSLAGGALRFPAEPAQMVKRTTIFMPGVLGADTANGRISKEIPSEQALAASGPKTRWCAPADARDEIATVQGSILLPNGKTMALKRRELEIKTFESARKKIAWKDVEQMGLWLQHFHDTPEPALLFPALRLMAQDTQTRNSLSLTEFLAAAFKAYPAAAEELQRKLPAEDRWTRLIGISVLGWAGYDNASLREGLPQEDKNALATATHANPYDLIPDNQIAVREDMLWSIFFATGRMQPVRAISTALAWGEDYNKLMERGRQMHDSGEKPSDEWPPYVARAAAYGAAGWSMSSLASSDALLSDYIDALKVAPDTPPSVKQELESLYKNPAFRMDRASEPPK